MTTTMAAEVPTIREMLGDRPAATQLNDGTGISASDTSIVVDDARLVRLGGIFEFADGTANNAEQAESQSQNTLTMTARRGVRGTTAATHSDNVVMYLDPLYSYNRIASAVNKVLNTDLLPNLYEVQEHEVTTSSTVGGHYVSSAADCEFILNIYQDLTSSSTHVPTPIEHFTQYRNVDTDLFATGKFFAVRGAVQNGTEKLYLNCAHAIAITTATDPQVEVVRYLACAHLLEWGEPRAVGDQNERKAKVGDHARLARYFREEGTKMLKRETSRLRKFAPVRREWLPRRPRVV